MKKSLIIVPLVGVGDVRFGDSREEVRNKFGAYKEFLRSKKFSKNTEDDFGFCHVAYDINNCCEAIMLFSGETDVLLNGKNIAGLPLSEFVKAIQGEKDDCGATSKELQISGYIENDQNIVDAVTVAITGYWK